MTENIHERSVRHTNSCYFTMVAVDHDHRPVSVRPLVPETDAEQRRYAQAQQRRLQRQELQTRYASLKIAQV